MMFPGVWMWLRKQFGCRGVTAGRFRVHQARTHCWACWPDAATSAGHAAHVGAKMSSQVLQLQARQLGLPLGELHEGRRQRIQAQPYIPIASQRMPCHCTHRVSPQPTHLRMEISLVVGSTPSARNLRPSSALITLRGGAVSPVAQSRASRCNPSCLADQGHREAGANKP